MKKYDLLSFLLLFIYLFDSAIKRLCKQMAI